MSNRLSQGEVILMDEKLYNVKKITKLHDVSEVNEYLELGWFLVLVQKTYDDETLYVLGWDKEESPRTPPLNII